MPRTRFTAALLLGSVLLTTGLGCGGGGGTSGSLEDVDLEFWSVFDNDNAYKEIISSYTTLHPNVNITYKKLRSDEYEDELIRALAEGEGPDIFSVHNDSVEEYKDLMLPMPASTTITYAEIQGTIRKETVVVTREQPTMSQKTLKSSFVDAVASDVIRDYQPDPKVEAEERVFGLPVSVDTLALFYNKDLLNAAGIAAAPITWDELQDDVIALTQTDTAGNITQSGAALGTSDNVERAPDVVAALMMQNGTNMTDTRGRVAFHTIPDDTPDNVFPGLDAVEFYTDFANPTKEVYTWNSDFPDSSEAFADGQTAFFFGYSYHVPLLRTAAPKLNFSVAKLPQIAGGREVNYANYWVNSVSKDTAHVDWAWDFVQYMADAKNVPTYLDETDKPPALRALINDALDDENVGSFTEQLLTARSWYHGNDVAATEEAMEELIDAILAGPEDPENTIEQAARIIAQTYE